VTGKGRIDMPKGPNRKWVAIRRLIGLEAKAK
jgi:hypothetical protein